MKPLEVCFIAYGTSDVQSILLQIQQENVNIGILFVLMMVTGRRILEDHGTMIKTQCSDSVKKPIIGNWLQCTKLLIAFKQA